MADKFTDAQINDFKESFQLFDENNDGTISTDEVGIVMRALGLRLTEQELRDMIAEVDTNKSGTIDFPEFLTLMSSKEMDNDSEDTIVQAFRMFDKDGNNKIDAGELRTAMSMLGEPLDEELLDQMMRAADTNGDGVIDYHEFAKIMFLSH